VLVKQWMSDQGLSQPPVLVSPGFWKQTTAEWFERASQAGRGQVEEMNISDARRTELREVAKYLLARTPVRQRAVAYMQYLAELPTEPPMPSPIAWLGAGPQPRVYQPGHADSQGPEAFAPHMMQVVYRKSPHH
jgi:hypothetical protein